MSEPCVIEATHPLLKERISTLRSVHTTSPEFRRTVTQATTLLFTEATAELPTHFVPVETPLTTTQGEVLKRQDFVLIPILRAGLGMVEGILNILPDARVGHVGLQRNETTLQSHEYYLKIPENLAESEVLVIDPMLATGGSARAALQQVKGRGAKHIRLLTLIAAPEGIAAVHAEHPDVPIYVGAIDECLNEKGYIVPGLGDAGDRLFGTL